MGKTKEITKSDTTTSIQIGLKNLPISYTFSRKKYLSYFTYLYTVMDKKNYFPKCRFKCL